MVKNWATQLTEHRKMSETNKESASDSENNKTEKEFDSQITNTR
jgi:hypothetical protein